METVDIVESQTELGVFSKIIELVAVSDSKIPTGGQEETIFTHENRLR